MDVCLGLGEALTASGRNYGRRPDGQKEELNDFGAPHRQRYGSCAGWRGEFGLNRQFHLKKTKQLPLVVV
jgi:hypothetical protein